MSMVSHHYNRPLSFLQKYYFIVPFIIDDNDDFLSKAIPICHITCKITFRINSEIFYPSSKTINEPHRNNFLNKMINIYHFIHQVTLYDNYFAHE